MTYTQILNETLAVYRQSGAQAAFDFVEKEAKSLAGNYPQIDNFRYALAAAAGKKQEAMAIMREAIELKGYWYSYEYLQADDDLDLLRKEADFEKWLQLCKDREEAARGQQESKVLLLGNEGQAKPTFLVLHGDQENLEIAKPYWEQVVEEGFMLVLQQSSQIEFSHGYNWSDVHQGVAEVGTYAEALQAEGLMGSSLWIGGFSAGCNVALRAMLDGAIEADHFVFMAPWLPDLDVWKPELVKLKEKGVTGHILVGDQDCDCQEGAEQLAALLTELGMEVTFDLIEDLNHDYPKDFSDRMRAWLK